MIPFLIFQITEAIREWTTTKDERNKKRDEKKESEHLKWTKTYRRLLRVRKAIDESKTVPGAKVYEHRM